MSGLALSAGCATGSAAADNVRAHPSWWTNSSAPAAGSSASSTSPLAATTTKPSQTPTTSPRSSAGDTATSRVLPGPTSDPTSTKPTAAQPASPARASGTGAIAARPASLRIVADWIPFSQARKDQTAAYVKRHYGVATWHLHPSMIVLHFTGSSSLSGARSTFASDAANRGELPGTCAHYIVGQDGVVHAIVPTTIICRHAIGVNDQAIGIEMVQGIGSHSGHWADQQILDRPAQIGAVLALLRVLRHEYAISVSNIIGHAMVNKAPQFVDLEGWRNDHVDWQPQDVAVVRARLARLG